MQASVAGSFSAVDVGETTSKPVQCTACMGKMGSAFGDLSQSCLLVKDSSRKTRYLHRRNRLTSAFSDQTAGGRMARLI